ncbi:MAG: hypothetical protein ABIY40_05395 [Rhodanobacteraceae bacterium]
MRKLGLFDELQRHHVFRVAAAYAVVAWLLIQIAAVTFPLLLLPLWVTRAVVALLLIGFPIALLLAWAFYVSPDGIARTGTDSPRPARCARTRATLVRGWA